MISIVVDNYMRSYLLPLVMMSYSRGQADEDVEMVIVDDGSEPRDHFVEYVKLGLYSVKPWFKVRAFRMPPECSHMNVGRTLNIGVKQSEGDLIILNHSDMLPLNPDVLKLVRAGHKESELTYLTPRFISVGYPMRDPPEGRDWILPAGASISRKLFDTIGGFDEQFRAYGPVDPDFAWRIRHAPKEWGFNPQQSKEIVYLHFRMARIPIRGDWPNPENDKIVLGNRGKVKVNPEGWGICEGLERISLG